MIGRTREVVWGGVFVALGVMLPLLFHGAGLGAWLLPMFWPVGAAAFYLPPWMAFVVGIVTPGISAALTGMPPVPTVYVMMIELSVLAGLMSCLSVKTGWGTFWIFFVGLLASRLVFFLSMVCFAPLIGLPGGAFGGYQLLKGLPGLVILLTVFPPLLSRLKRRPLFRREA